MSMSRLFYLVIIISISMLLLWLLFNLIVALFNSDYTECLYSIILLVLFLLFLIYFWNKFNWVMPVKKEVNKNTDIILDKSETKLEIQRNYSEKISWKWEAGFFKKYLSWKIIFIITFFTFLLILWIDSSNQGNEMKSINHDLNLAMMSIWPWNQVSFDAIIDDLNNFTPSSDELKAKKIFYTKFVDLIKEIQLLFLALNKEDAIELNEATSIINHLEKSKIFILKINEMLDLRRSYLWHDNDFNIEQLFKASNAFREADIEFYKYKLGIINHISINKDWDIEIDNDSMIKRYNELLDKREIAINNAIKTKDAQAIK